MADIELLDAPQSVYVRTVRLACKEKGVRYSLTPAMPHSREIEALHPFSKIPAMRHDDFTLFESRAIAAYADRVFDGPMLVPDDSKNAALVKQRISVFNIDVFPRLLAYMRDYSFPTGPGGQPDRDAIKTTLPSMCEQVGLLDRAMVNTGHLAGNRFTLADM